MSDPFADAGAGLSTGDASSASSSSSGAARRHAQLIADLERLSTKKFDRAAARELTQQATGALLADALRSGDTRTACEMVKALAVVTGLSKATGESDDPYDLDRKRELVEIAKANLGR